MADNAPTHGDLIERMGITIDEAGPDGARGSMPVAGNTQPFGLLHGGASAVLAESLGSVAANHAGHPERVAVGAELNITHHRSVRSGRVHGVAAALHVGRTTAAYQVAVTDDEGRAVAPARLLCVFLPAEGRGGD